MGANLISKDAFTEMIRAMDKDGDGTVDEEEFKDVYKAMFPKVSDDEFKAIWKQIDADGDGNLTVIELATFYGYAWDESEGAGGGVATEMSDEQILEALAMYAAVEEQKLARNPMSKLNVPTPVEEETKKKARDPTLVTINLDRQKNKDPDAVEAMILLCEAIQLGDLIENKEKNDVESLLAAHPNVRFVDQKGEMPLHKLARFVPPAGLKDAYKRNFLNLTKLMRDGAHKEKRHLQGDVNHQSGDGKTPLMIAIEFKNTQMIDLLFSLDREGPDSLLCNAQGWTVAHTAAKTDDIEVIKQLFSYFSAARKKVLNQTKDKTGRTPLHIAGYSDSSDVSNICGFLLENGAKNDVKDAAGNTASVLAGKSGRRNSKELIEQMTGTAETPKTPRRMSKEGTSAMLTSTAATPR